MKNRVHEWVQEGRLFIWRYTNPRSGWRGWHFTADPTGCASIRDLLDRMHAGEPSHRTLKLETVTEAILDVPNYGQKIAGHFQKLRIAYQPDFEGLRIAPDGEALTMTVGDRRMRELASAFADVENGDGDFGIATSDDRKAETWMFWWMPNIKHHDGKRL